MVEHMVIYSDKVDKPTIVLFVPEDSSEKQKKEGLEKELERFLGNSTPENTQTLFSETNPAFDQKSYEYSGNTTLRKKDIEEYLKKNNLKFNGKDIEVPEDENDVDWFSFFADMVRKSNLRFIENKKFTQSLELTLFSALLGYSIAIGGELGEPKESMIGINYKRHGLFWLSYPEKTMRVILRKGLYNDVDRHNKVIYSEQMTGVKEARQNGIINESQIRSSTFGNYPYYQIDIEQDEIDDPEYIRDLIEKATKM